jgi:general secretion pathway protein N
MMIERTVASLALLAALALTGAAEAQTRLAAAPANIDTNSLPTGLTPPPTGDPVPSGLIPGGIVPSQGNGLPQPVGERELRGNPLWAIPLKTLTATRERPLFTPSRRAPTPVIAGPPPPQPVAAAPPPAPPEKPRLTLVGAIVGERESIAVLLDEGTRDVVRLKTGESHAGWVLRSVRRREVTLEKDRETMILALPVPGQQKTATPEQL